MSDSTVKTNDTAAQKHGAAKKCGNCLHFNGRLTSTGRWQPKAGECNGVVTLVAPMAYKVVLQKHYVWPKDDAAKCSCHEFSEQRSTASAGSEPSQAE